MSTNTGNNVILHKALTFNTSMIYLSMNKYTINLYIQIIRTQFKQILTQMFFLRSLIYNLLGKHSVFHVQLGLLVIDDEELGTVCVWAIVSHWHHSSRVVLSGINKFIWVFYILRYKYTVDRFLNLFPTGLSNMM